MGLDINWYRGLRLANEGEGLDEDGEPDFENDYFGLYRNDRFPGRADEIVDGGVYQAEEHGDFRAGSYGTYNAWREDLAELAGYRMTGGRHDETAFRARSGPFWELICFSDSEGAIGAAISQKLAADFAEYQSKADAHPDEYFRKKYGLWRVAFEKAADRGAVKFS